MIALAVQTQIAAFRLLGMVTVADRHIEVLDKGENTLWLNYLDGQSRRSLGIIRWDEVRTPQLTFASQESWWVCSGSQRADELVASAMGVYRGKLGLPDHPGPPAPTGTDDPVLIRPASATRQAGSRGADAELAAAPALFESVAMPSSPSPAGTWRGGRAPFTSG